MFKRRDKKSGSDSLDKDKMEKEKKKLMKKETKDAKSKTATTSSPSSSTTASPTKPATAAASPTPLASAVPGLKLNQTLRPTPSPHGPIAVPPRPSAVGGAGHILGAAYSTRSNVPVLRVPLTPHVLPSMTAHRLSAEGALPPTSLSAQPFATTTELSPQQQQQPASATSPTPPAWRPAGAAGDGGRLRAASMSEGGAAVTAAPGGAGASAADRRKSLLSPISPQQMKAALRDDEFSYFAEEDKAAAARKLTTTTTQAAPKAGSTSPAGAPTKLPQQPQQPQQQPRLTHEQARTMRMAALAAAREGRPQRAQRPVRGLAPIPNAAQAEGQRSNARADAFVARPVKEWKGASRQGTGTLRLNLAALRSQSFRDPSGFATLKRRAPTFLASPERERPEEKESNPEEIVISLGSHKSEIKRSERLTRTMSVRDTDLFKLEKQANVIVAAMKKRQLEKREEEEREAKESKAKAADEATSAAAEAKQTPAAAPVVPEAPPAPALPPPPPPPPAGDDKGVTMLAQSEDYEDIFGIALARLERVKGIYRWRIENLRPVLISNDAVGHAPHMFHKRDCYLVLKVTSDEKVDAAGKASADPKQEISSASMNYALHYWIGSEASVDKTGSVCFRAVQLNSFIGGRAKHVHEVQGEESPLFVSYYQDYIQAAKAEGLVYLEGGTETAFRKAPKVGVEYEVPRLYRFYFKNGARCIQRVHLELETLDYNEVFLLDTGGMKLYQYNGEKASTRLQYECSDLANLINTHDRKSQATIEIIKRDEDGNFDLGSQFWSYFPPKKPFVTKKEKERLFARHDALFDLLKRLEQRVDALDAKHVGADYAADQAQQMQAAKRKANEGLGPLITGDWYINEGETEELRDDAMEILCLAGELGEMNVVSKWKQGPDTPKPARSLLADPERVFIFDCVSEIFVYMGAKSSPLAQQIGAHLAENMRTDTDPGAVRRPAWATVEQIKERSEPVLFKARFDKWVEDDQPKGKSKNACKRPVVDFRGAHERILDGIRERAKKFGSADDRSSLPTLDVATLFPVREPKPADAATASQAGAGTSGGPAVDDELVAVEVGILTGGKTFIKINEAEQGLFFSAECYFILETYKPRPAPQGEGDKPKWRVYFWEGKDASSLRFPMFVLGLQPLLEEKILRSGSPKPEVERIYQGKEPLAFMKIFERMISISKGLRKDSLARAQEERLKGKVLMYHCLHTAADDTMRMVEVPAVESSLDSHHSFLVHSFQPKANATPDPNGMPELEKKLFVWHGAQSPKTTREALMEYVNVLGHTEEETENKELEIVVAEEKGEDADFWMTLGCDDVPLHRQTAAAATSGADVSSGAGQPSSARLCRFYFEGSGQFKAAEVVDYGQKDLASGAVYLLDSGRADDPQPLHLWMGNDIGETLRVGARHVAAQYASFLLSRASLQRRSQQPTAQAGLPPLKKREVVEVAEGQEPPEFTAHFKDWTRAVFVDPYEVRLRERAERERREVMARLEKAKRKREREERRARGEAVSDEEEEEEDETSEHNSAE